MKLNYKKFIVGFLLAGLVVFGLLSFLGRNFKSETFLIFYPKNSLLADNVEMFLGNAKIIGQEIKLYDKIFKTDSFVNSKLLQKNRKEWSKKLNIERLGKSSILKVAISGNDLSDTEKLAEKYIQFYAAELAKNYNIKNEISFAVLEGPIVYQNNRANIGFNILYGILTGILGGLVFNLIKERKITTQKIDRDFFKKELARKYEPEKGKDKLKVEEEKPCFESAQKQEIKEVKDIFMAEKTASAPLNLPIAGNDIEKMFGATKNGLGYKIEKKSEVKKETEKSGKTEEKKDNFVFPEATPEEVKERLNKLLGNI